MTGSLIGGVFGLIFVLANTAELPTVVASLLRGLAVGAFVAVIVQIRRQRPPRGTATYGSDGGSSDQGGSDRGGFGRGYWLIVAAEVAAFVVGGLLLNGPLDEPDAGVAWVAFVVGVHFFGLARLWRLRMFDWLGGALALCGAVGLALAFADADQAAVDTVGGVVPGAVLLAFALWGSRPAAA